jgi:hypothetical protein
MKCNGGENYIVKVEKFPSNNNSLSLSLSLSLTFSMHDASANLSEEKNANECSNFARRKFPFIFCNSVSCSITIYTLKLAENEMKSIERDFMTDFK